MKVFYECFNENTLQYLKEKITQVQIIIFNKEAVLEISEFSTQRTDHETMLNFVLRFCW